MASRLVAAVIIGFWAAFATAQPSESLRFATYNVELTRKGAGLLLRDIRKGDDPQIIAVADVIGAVSPDVLALQTVDWDADLRTARALNSLITQRTGLRYPYVFAYKPNSGMATGLDMNGDGRLRDAADSQGFGAFTGARGMLLLSRVPIDEGQSRNFSHVLWKDLSFATLPRDPDGDLFPSVAAIDKQRLANTGLWQVALQPDGWPMVHVLMAHPAPPVFDGAEDRNGLRNADEIKFIDLLMDRQSMTTPIVGLISANIDPHDGEGRHEALRNLLGSKRLRDVAPSSHGARSTSDPTHKTDAAHDTVEWRGPGRLRVDFALPSMHFDVADSGVFWPADGDPMAETVARASRHRLVWVDLSLAPD